MKDAIRVALSKTRAGQRSLLGACAFVGLAERLSVVGAAALLAADRAPLAAAFGAAGAVLFAARRLARATLRVGFEAELYREGARALLEGDVLRARPTGDDPQAVLFDGVYRGARLVADALPQLASDLVASAALAVFLAATQEGRVLVVGAAVALAAVAVVFAVQRAVARLQRDVTAGFDDLIEQLLAVIHGRVELVARGRGRAAMVLVDRALGRYRRATLAADRTSALLARAPLVAAVLAGAVALVALGGLDALRSAGDLSRARDAIVLASTLPAFAGLATALQETTRAATAFRPLAALLSIPRGRRDTGTSAPKLPAPITAQDLTCAYPGGAPVLRALSFTWRPGEALVVSGPNGSGKSTLLRALVALLEPVGGTLRVGERALSEIDLDALRAQIAYLPQRPYLGDQATVRRAVHLLAPEASDAAALDALERVGLFEALASRGDPLDVPVSELSSGQRQRVALARVLVQDAALVLLDEPDANLDREGVARVAEIVGELTAEGRMVAIAAHTPDLRIAPATELRLSAPPPGDTRS